MKFNASPLAVCAVVGGLCELSSSVHASTMGLSSNPITRRSPQDAPKPDTPVGVSTGSDSPTEDVQDASSTQYSNYTSYTDQSDHYANGTQKSNTPTAPKKVDASGDYSAYYPPPPSLSLPPFSGIPYPLPLTGVKKHCPPQKKDDGMTVALPSDLYTGKISKCGQKVVVVFEDLAGQKWSGPKNNLTLTVIDAFDRNDRTEVGRTVLLSEKAWKEATGNAIINKFESWPVRWFFLDAAMQQDTADGTHENTDGESEGGGSGNSTTYYQAPDANSTSPSSNSQNGTSQNTQSSNDSSNARPPPEKDFDPTKAPTHDKRNLLSRRSSKSQTQRLAL